MHFTVVKILTGLIKNLQNIDVSLYFEYRAIRGILCNVRLDSLMVLVFSAIQVNAVAFSPDEKYFATCSEDGSVRVWLVSSIELVVQFQVLSQVKE